MNDLNNILKVWSVEFAAEEPSIEIEGSSERTTARTVVRDAGGGRWILEQIKSDHLSRKKQIAEQLGALSGLQQIHPYLKTADGSFFVDYHMLRPFVDGIALDRETYLNDSWRIDSMADFLIGLRDKTATPPGLPPSPRFGGTGRFPLRGKGTGEIPSRGGVREAGGGFFSITAYAEGRMAVWRKRHSELAQKLEPSFSKLKQNFFPVHDRLPVAFCHGDYHPLNMVWGEGRICSVIDWEFCGMKPELYDVALLLGCFGFDDPDNLIKEPAIRLVKKLRGSGFGDAVSWAYLLDLMAAIRWGWMSEWIRRSETEAQEMEALYIDILIDQKEYILETWDM